MPLCENGCGNEAGPSRLTIFDKHTVTAVSEGHFCSDECHYDFWLDGVLPDV